VDNAKFSADELTYPPAPTGNDVEKCEGLLLGTVDNGKFSVEKLTYPPAPTGNDV
jgi:hypothetical protein